MLRLFTVDTNHLAPLDNLPPAPLALAGTPCEAPAGLVWVDLESPTDAELRPIEQRLGVKIPSRADMEEIELSARLYTENGAEFMTMTAVTNLDTDDPVKTPVGFILKDATLVTVRFDEPKPFANYRARAQRGGLGTPCNSGELVMAGLIEAILDRLADVLERIGREVDAVSREVFRGKAANANKMTRDLRSLIERVGIKGDLLNAVRESLVSISRLINHHASLDSSDRKANKEARQHVKLIQRDAAHLLDHANFLANKINFLLDATLGLINLEQNQIIKIFSVAAVVFLPPTLVASSYGMNFKNIPELEWAFGYPWALCLMAISAALPFLYFKRRGWI
jgi:magnesium transporter